MSCPCCISNCTHATPPPNTLPPKHPSSFPVPLQASPCCGWLCWRPRLPACSWPRISQQQTLAWQCWIPASQSRCVCSVRPACTLALAASTHAPPPCDMHPCTHTLRPHITRRHALSMHARTGLEITLLPGPRAGTPLGGCLSHSCATATPALGGRVLRPPPLRSACMHPPRGCAGGPTAFRQLCTPPPPARCTQADTLPSSLHLTCIPCHRQPPECVLPIGSTSYTYTPTASSCCPSPVLLPACLPAGGQPGRQQRSAGDLCRQRCADCHMLRPQAAHACQPLGCPGSR